MLNNIKALPLIIGVVMLLFLVACEENPGEIPVEQAAQIAQAYFKEMHDLDITMKSVSYEQVGLHKYLNFVTVSDGETEYRLILDEKNKPLSDNVSAVTATKTLTFLYLQRK